MHLNSAQDRLVIYRQTLKLHYFKYRKNRTYRIENEGDGDGGVLNQWKFFENSTLPNNCFGFIAVRLYLNYDMKVLPVFPYTGSRWLDGGGRIKVVCVYLSIRIAEIVHSFVNPQYWSRPSPSLISTQATDKCVWKHGRNKLDSRSTRTSRIFRAVYPCTSFECIKRKSDWLSPVECTNKYTNCSFMFFK